MAEVFADAINGAGFECDVAQEKGQPKVHVHIVVGRSDGTTRGGHLMEGHVRPTLEVIQRRYIARVLEHAGHNKTAAAAILGRD